MLAELPALAVAGDGVVGRRVRDLVDVSVVRGFVLELGEEGSDLFAVVEAGSVVVALECCEELGEGVLVVAGGVVRLVVDEHDLACVGVTQPVEVGDEHAVPAELAGRLVGVVAGEDLARLPANDDGPVLAIGSETACDLVNVAAPSVARVEPELLECDLVDGQVTQGGGRLPRHPVTSHHGLVALT